MALHRSQLVIAIFLLAGQAHAAKGIISSLLDDNTSSICRLLTQVKEKNEQGQMAWKTKQLCSSTLIDGDDTEGRVLQAKESRYLLTAGHCPPMKKDPIFQGKEVRVIAQCPGGHESVVDGDMIIHPGYLKEPFLSKEDFAVGRLQKPLQIAPARLTPLVSLVAVNDSMHYCALAGYGKNNEGEVGQLSVIALNPRTMRMAENMLSFYIFSSPETGEIVPGDSGGPVFCRIGGAGTPAVFAVNSNILLKKMGVANAVSPQIPWIRAHLGNWERIRLGQAPIQDLENHMTYQGRVQLCAQKTMATRRGSFPQVARQILAGCDGEMRKALALGFNQTDFLRAILNGMYLGDLSQETKVEVKKDILLHPDWNSLESELQVILERSGF